MKSIGIIALAFFAGTLGGGLVFKSTQSKTSSLPDGAIMAFAQNCPQGWHPFKKANGRFLLAAGASQGLVPRQTGETGGVDELGFKVTRRYLSADSADDGIASGNVIVPEGTGRKIRTMLELAEQAMPPFIVVKLCSYIQEK